MDKKTSLFTLRSFIQKTLIYPKGRLFIQRTLIYPKSAYYPKRRLKKPKNGTKDYSKKFKDAYFKKFGKKLS
jgi:hypothetical protein